MKNLFTRVTKGGSERCGRLIQKVGNQVICLSVMYSACKNPSIVLFEHKDTTGVDGSFNFKGGLLEQLFE